MNDDTRRTAADFVATFKGSPEGQRVLDHLNAIYKDRFLADGNEATVLQKSAQHDVVLYIFSMIELGSNEPKGNLQ